MEQNQVNMWLSMNANKFRQQDLAFVKNKLEAMSDDSIMYLPSASLKKPSTIFLIALLLGWERFLLDDIGLGILKIITGYGCGIWWLIDIFTAKERAKKYNFQQFQKATAFVGGNGNTVSFSSDSQAPILPYNTNTSHSSKGFIAVIIVVAFVTVLLTGYFVLRKSVYNLFSNRAGIEKMYEQNRQAIEQQIPSNNVSNQTSGLSTPNTAQPEVQKAAPISNSDISSQSQSSSNTNSSIPGRFPQASERLLSVSDLQGLSKADLKIMRNEIFARHGYIFQTQAMKSYFQQQSWYVPKYSNVTSMLTSVEMKNVELIKRYE